MCVWGGLCVGVGVLWLCLCLGSVCLCMCSCIAVIVCVCMIMPFCVLVFTVLLRLIYIREMLSSSSTCRPSSAFLTTFEV